jgi:hypothetical protein
MIFFLNIPYENSLVHAGGYNKARIWTPAKVEDVFGVAHQFTLGRPAQDSLRSVDGEAVLSLFPDGDAFVIGAGCEEASMWGVADYVSVFVSFEETIEYSNVFFIWVN